MAREVLQHCRALASGTRMDRSSHPIASRAAFVEVVMRSRILSFARRFVVSLGIVSMLTIAKPADAIERQHASNWCWAAAIQDVVAQKLGVYLPQDAIVARLTGWPMNRGAYAQEVAAVIQSFGLHGFIGGALSPDQMGMTLGAGAKVIALIDPTGGAEGHFVVLEGALPNAVVVADPATGMTQAVPWQIVYQWNWIASVVVR